jgi:hypothetical protein
MSSHFGVPSLSMKELAERLPKTARFMEDALVWHDNWVIAWTDRWRRAPEVEA